MREPTGATPESLRQRARAAQRWYAGAFFGDAAAPAAGAPVCAVDLDGCMEADAAGALVLTPLGAVALRALGRHGYAAVIVTGRSLDQVVNRCDAYALTGGVAEYGTALYDRAAGATRSLLPPEDQAAVDALRRRLAAIDGVTADERYRQTARGYVFDAAGRRRSLDPATVAELATPGLRPVDGGTQTDFVPRSFDKGRGLRAFLESRGDPPLAFAIGDSPEDLPMLAMAARAFTPANGHPDLAAAGATVTDGACQMGFSEAVGALLGHEPGGCPACRPPELGPEQSGILTRLAALDA